MNNTQKRGKIATQRQTTCLVATWSSLIASEMGGYQAKGKVFNWKCASEYAKFAAGLIAEMKKTARLRRDKTDVLSWESIRKLINELSRLSRCRAKGFWAAWSNRRRILSVRQSKMPSFVQTS